MQFPEVIIANRRKVLLWFMYALVIGGAVFHIFYLIDHNPVNHIWSDPERHWVQGIDTERNDPMTMTDPVLFQLYIAALSKLTFKDPALLAFYTILLSLLTPWAWYKFFRELQPSREIAIGGSVVLIWLPSWLCIYTYFMQETLMLPLLGIALWMTWRCKRKQTLNSFLIMVLVWALAGLTRGICIPMAAVATTWLWVIQTGKPAKAIYSLLILSLILGPLTYRSFQHMGILAPHGVGQMNMIYAKSGKQEIQMTYRRQGAIWFFGFGSPSTGIAPFAPLSDWRTRRSGKVYATVDIDKGYEDWKRNLEYHKLSLGEYLWITRENLIFLFFGESWPDTDHSYKLGKLNYLMRWIWAPLTVVLIGVTALLWRSQKRYLLLPSIIVAWLIVQGFLPLAVNEGRYRKPLEGLLIAQAVLLAGTWLRYRKDQEDNQLLEAGTVDVNVQTGESGGDHLAVDALSNDAGQMTGSAETPDRGS